MLNYDCYRNGIFSTFYKKIFLERRGYVGCYLVDDIKLYTTKLK